VLAVARMLRGWDRLTAVTNSLPAATSWPAGVRRLIVVGGELRERSQALVGPLTHPLLESIHVDAGAHGHVRLSLEEGMTTTDPAEASTKELALSRAREVILLADSRKFGTSSLVGAGRLDAIDILVTDDGIDAGAVR